MDIKITFGKIDKSNYSPPIPSEIYDWSIDWGAPTKPEDWALMSMCGRSNDIEDALAAMKNALSKAVRVYWQRHNPAIGN